MSAPCADGTVMASLAESYPTVLAALANHYGQPLSAPKGRSAFEAVLASALSRSSDPARAEATLEALDRSGLLEPMTLAGIEPSELLDSLRDAFLSLPARSATLLVRLARWYSKAFSIADLAHDPAAREMFGLRAELAAINGVGPATADAILLAMGQPTYPVDRATYRILFRHGWIDSTTEYEQASELLSRQASGNSEEIAHLSTWLVQIGRQYCVPRSPRCQHCPLRCVLPDQGPLEPDS
jgi:endonuclease III related protein